MEFILHSFGLCVFMDITVYQVSVRRELKGLQNPCKMTHDPLLSYYCWSGRSSRNSLMSVHLTLTLHSFCLASKTSRASVRQHNGCTCMSLNISYLQRSRVGEPENKYSTYQYNNRSVWYILYKLICISQFLLFWPQFGLDLESGTQHLQYLDKGSV